MSGFSRAASVKYRPDIDGLRAIAVLHVVFYHFQIGPFSGGFVGVDIFFVISGYLITSLIHTEMTNGTFSLISFYERRVRRILPAANLHCLCDFCLISGSEYLGRSLRTSIGFLSASLSSVGVGARRITRVEPFAEEHRPNPPSDCVVGSRAYSSRYFCILRRNAVSR